MYERNAIVLERYFNKIFDFDNENSVKENYYNYRKLFECYGMLCDAKKQEEVSKEEFEVSEKEITKLQKSQERLYNKGAKYEYSRYIIFNNVEEKIEKIEKHLNKVADDVKKNSDELKELGDMFVQAIINYNEKNVALSEAIERRKNTQKEYDEIYLKAKNCFNGIPDEVLSNIKEFVNSDNREVKKELQETFDENGKKEKNQFDPDVISYTINKSIEINKIELDIYLTGYERIAKLFEEIEADFVKNDKHLKFYKDSEAKMNFVNAEKDYIVQFLDNERIGAIYDKKVHRKLMLEACKKFVLDFEQIDKLYEIITKEMAGRYTKKIYKENYNKSYLIELENSSIEPSLDTGRMRQEAIAFMNLNYWRVEGIRNIYDTFENIVTTIYERDLSEFVPEEVVKEPESEQSEEEITEEPDEEVIDENIIELEQEDEIDYNSEEEYIEEPTIDVFEDKEIPVDDSKSKKVSRRVYYSSKKQLARAIYFSLQNIEFAKNRQNIIEELQTEDDDLEENNEEIIEEEEDYSVPENVKEILKNVEAEENKRVIRETNEFDLRKLDDIEYEEDDVLPEDVEKTEEFSDEEYDEDSILDIYFKDDEESSENVTREIKNEKGAHLEKKAGIFKKLVGLNSKKKREVNN